MYKATALIALATVFTACKNGNTNGDFELKGNFANSKGEMIYLEKLTPEKAVVVDSVTLAENGEFAFTNYQPKIGFYRVRVTPQNFAMLILDSADKVNMTGDINDLGNTYKVEGSAETALFLEFNELARSRELRLDSLNKAFQSIMENNNMNAARMDSVSKLFEAPYYSIVNSTNEKIVEKIQKHLDMMASLSGIQTLDFDMYSASYQALAKGLEEKYPKDRNVKMFRDMVDAYSELLVGKQAPDIELEAPDGKMVALSSLKGKVVLIDFWASWCGPCRKEMPTVVKAYAKYKNKGFEIFGVSLDQDKDRWVEAIQKDGITWPQVSDLQGWKSSVVRLYNFQSIPFTVLIDREGAILAKNLRGEELEQKLKTVLQ